MRLTSTIARMARDFAVFYRLTELKVTLLRARAQAAFPGFCAGDVAATGVSLFATWFVLSTARADSVEDIQQLSCHQHTLARAKGARQQQEVQESPGPQSLVRQCGPWT